MIEYIMCHVLSNSLIPLLTRLTNFVAVEINKSNTDFKYTHFIYSTYFYTASLF